MAEAWKLSMKQRVLETAADTALELAKKAAKQAQEASDVVRKTIHESGFKDSLEETATWTKEQLDKTGVTEVASRVADTVEETAAWAREQLDKTGVTEVASKVADTVGEEFDKISGKKLLDLVEERLALQARYNDILASKLDEALQCIAAIEAHRSKEDRA